MNQSTNFVTHCIAALSMLLCPGQNLDRSKWPKDTELPRSTKVVRVVKYEEYKVSLLSGWSSRKGDQILTAFPVGVPGMTIDFQQISKKPLSETAFNGSRLALKWLRGYPSHPIRGHLFIGHTPCQIYTYPHAPDQNGFVKDHYAYIIFFPKSVLMARINVSIHLGKLASQVAKEVALVIGRTTEELGK